MHTHLARHLAGLDPISPTLTCHLQYVHMHLARHLAGLDRISPTPVCHLQHVHTHLARHLAGLEKLQAATLTVPRLLDTNAGCFLLLRLFLQNVVELHE